MPDEPESIPVVSAEVVQRYEQLGAALAQIQSDLPRLAERSDVQELRQRHAALAQVMQSGVICLGVAGPPQVGKSLAVCRLLGLDPSTSPAYGGRPGVPTTTATRIRRRAGAAREVTLQYMTEEEYRARVTAVCGLLGLDPAQAPDDLLAAAERRLTDGSAPSHTAAYLIALLKSYHDWVGVLGTVEPGFIEDQQACLTPAPEDATQFPLLREMVVDYPPEDLGPDGLPDGVELLDLPGLVTSDQVDDLVTERLLGGLQAVFVCQSLTSGPALPLLARLHEPAHRDRLRQRIWLVLTQADTPPADPQAWERFQDAQERYDIPASRVLSLRLGDGLAGWPGDEEPFPDDFAATAAPPARSSAPAAPGGLPPEPAWQAAYGELARDGGLERWRQAVRDQCAELRREAAQRAESECRRLQEQLYQVVEAEAQSSVMSPAALANAANWETDLLNLLLELPRDRKLVEEPAAALQETLQERLSELTRGDPKMKLPDAEMRDLHSRVCQQLEQLACQHAGRYQPPPDELPAAAPADASGGVPAAAPVTTAAAAPPAAPPASGDPPGTIQQIYQRVQKQHLDRIRVPAVEIGSGDSRRIVDPRARWRQDARQDLTAPGWATDTFRAFATDPFPGVETLTREEYVSVMRRKIGCQVHALAVKVLHQIDEHLERYRAEVRLLRGGDRAAGPGNPRILPRLLQQLAPTRG